MKKHERGFGLLEAMLSLAVIAVIFIFALRQGQHWLFERDVATIRSSVSYLQQGMDLYYFNNCQAEQTQWQAANGQPIPISMTTIAQYLQDSGGGPNAIQNPWSPAATDSFSMVLTPVQSTATDENSVNPNYWLYKLTIQMALNKEAATIPGIAGILNATSVVNGVATWTWIPTQDPSNAQSGYWVLNPQLRSVSNYALYVCNFLNDGKCPVATQSACPA